MSIPIPKDEMCPICFFKLEDSFSRPKGCSHMYHAYCLKKWTQKKSNCPTCRLEFKEMECFDPDPDGFLHPTNSVKLRNTNNLDKELEEDDLRALQEQEEVPNLTVCELCGMGTDEDQLMLCDQCDFGYHTYCLGLSAVPDGEWFCERCVIAGNVPASWRRGRRTQRDVESVMEFIRGERPRSRRLIPRTALAERVRTEVRLLHENGINPRMERRRLRAGIQNVLEESTEESNSELDDDDESCDETTTEDSDEADFESEDERVLRTPPPSTSRSAEVRVVRRRKKRTTTRKSTKKSNTRKTVKKTTKRRKTRKTKGKRRKTTIRKKRSSNNEDSMFDLPTRRERQMRSPVASLSITGCNMPLVEDNGRSQRSRLFDIPGASLQDSPEHIPSDPCDLLGSIINEQEKTLAPGKLFKQEGGRFRASNSFDMYKKKIESKVSTELQRRLQLPSDEPTTSSRMFEAQENTGSTTPRHITRWNNSLSNNAEVQMKPSTTHSEVVLEKHDRIHVATGILSSDRGDRAQEHKSDIRKRDEDVFERRRRERQDAERARRSQHRYDLEQIARQEERLQREEQRIARERERLARERAEFERTERERQEAERIECEREDMRRRIREREKRERELRERKEREREHREMEKRERRHIEKDRCDKDCREKEQRERERCERKKRDRKEREQYEQRKRKVKQEQDVVNSEPVEDVASHTTSWTPTAIATTAILPNFASFSFDTADNRSNQLISRDYTPFSFEPNAQERPSSLLKALQSVKPDEIENIRMKRAKERNAHNNAHRHKRLPEKSNEIYMDSLFGEENNNHSTKNNTEKINQVKLEPASSPLSNSSDFVPEEPVSVPPGLRSTHSDERRMHTQVKLEPVNCSPHFDYSENITDRPVSIPLPTQPSCIDSNGITKRVKLEPNNSSPLHHSGLEPAAFEPIPPLPPLTNLDELRQKNKLEPTSSPPTDFSSVETEALQSRPTPPPPPVMIESDNWGLHKRIKLEPTSSPPVDCFSTVPERVQSMLLPSQELHNRVKLEPADALECSGALPDSPLPEI